MCRFSSHQQPKIRLHNVHIRISDLLILLSNSFHRFGPLTFDPECGGETKISESGGIVTAVPPRLAVVRLPQYKVTSDLSINSYSCQPLTEFPFLALKATLLMSACFSPSGREGDTSLLPSSLLRSEVLIILYLAA